MNPLLDQLIWTTLNNRELTTAAGRERFVRRIGKHLRRIPDSLDRYLVTVMVVQVSGLPEEVIFREAIEG